MRSRTGTFIPVERTAAFRTQPLAVIAADHLAWKGQVELFLQDFGNINDRFLQIQCVTLFVAALVFLQLQYLFLTCRYQVQKIFVKLVYYSISASGTFLEDITTKRTLQSDLLNASELQANLSSQWRSNRSFSIGQPAAFLNGMAAFLPTDLTKSDFHIHLEIPEYMPGQTKEAKILNLTKIGHKKNRHREKLLTPDQGSRSSAYREPVHAYVEIRDNLED